MAMVAWRIPTTKLRRSLMKHIAVCKVIIPVVCVIGLIYICLTSQHGGKSSPHSESSHGDLYVELPDYINVMEYPPFEPEVDTDFNFNDDGKPKIEKIIHQT